MPNAAGTSATQSATSSSIATRPSSTSSMTVAAVNCLVRLAVRNGSQPVSAGPSTAVPDAPNHDAVLVPVPAMTPTFGGTTSSSHGVRSGPLGTPMSGTGASSSELAGPSSSS